MARFLSRTLALTRTLAPTRLSPATSLAPRTTAITPDDHFYYISTYRNYSYKAQLIEIDLDSSASDSSGEIHVDSSTSASDDGGRTQVLGLNKLEDAIHMIIVRRCAPDWLPFIPGSSYWVPPKPRANNIVDLVGKLTNPLTEEERLSLTTVRGWPCTSHLLQGDASHRQDSKEVEVQVHMQSKLREASQSEDED